MIDEVGIGHYDDGSDADSLLSFDVEDACDGGNASLDDTGVSSSLFDGAGAESGARLSPSATGPLSLSAAGGESETAASFSCCCCWFGVGERSSSTSEGLSTTSVSSVWFCF